MTDTAIQALTAPKQMKTIITLLNLVRSELFITIDHAERCLEMFISERQSNASLQQFIQALQQIRGSLILIEISGATLLTDLMLRRALAVLEDASEKWDNTLSVLSTSIFTLRRYLENFEGYPDLLSELLIPIINELRATEELPPLPTSFFIGIKVSHPPLLNPLPRTLDHDAFGRLRQMYQIGLLGLIREQNKDVSLRMMSRAMDRLQKTINNESAARLCLITSAALEAFTDSKMTAYPARKKLFSRVDQQLRNTQNDNDANNDSLLKDLLYTILLDNALGSKALEVFMTYNLVPLPYNNEVLEAEMVKLAGPGQSAICSFTAAVREELIQTQSTIDTFTNQNEDHQTLIEPLLHNLKHLIKTLSLVNLQAAEVMLKEQIGILEINKSKDRLSTHILDNLADVILHVEGIILNYEASASCDNKPQVVSDEATPANNAINQYLKQGRTLAIQESLSGISIAQQNITGYIESKGDKQYLEKLPQILDEIYGCLLFLNQKRAAKIIRQCSYYINTNMLINNSLPDTNQLDNLADVLASLEFFIETGMLKTTSTENKILELAEKSLITLNVPDIDISINDSDEIPYNTVKKPQSNSIFETNIDTNTSLMFAESDESHESGNHTGDFTDFDFNFDSTPSFAKPEEQLLTAPLFGEAPLTTPAPQTSTPLSKLALEPLKEKIESDTQKDELKPLEIKKPEKDDDDDISFSRPENWTLS